MKKVFFAAALCAFAATSGAAFAERSVFPANGMVSASMMKDGEVKLMVKMPAAEFVAMKADMKDPKGDECKIMSIYPGETDTMILVCGEDELIAPGG